LWRDARRHKEKGAQSLNRWVDDPTNDVTFFVLGEGELKNLEPRSAERPDLKERRKKKKGVRNLAQQGEEDRHTMTSKKKRRRGPAFIDYCNMQGRERVL